MPKVKRRLRDDERKLIKSGQVFVFDEKESGIKRWTDGLLWSPSRILFNFLVYRQVEKKAPATARTGSQQNFHSPLLSPPSSSSVTAEQLNPLALGAIGFDDPSFSSPSNSSNMNVKMEDSRMRSSSTTTDSYSGWESLSMLEGFNVVPQSTSSALDAHPVDVESKFDRSLVGSLTTSYPFAKGGLCKKTISIQVENSTQHLISYYTVEDVRSGRLRTPSSLPEIASLAISPIFLTKTSFRFPPSIRYGLDGIPRFDGEDESLLFSKRDGQESSGGEGTSSGSEARHFQRQHQARPHSMQGHSRGKSLGGGTSRGRAMTLAGQTQGQNFNLMVSSSSQPSIRAPPLPHQIGGSGTLPSSRRSFDAISRSNRNRFEPYPGSVIGSTVDSLSTQQHGKDHQALQSLRQQDQLQTDFFTSGMHNGALQIRGDSNEMFTSINLSSPPPNGAPSSSMLPPQQSFATTTDPNPAMFSAFPDLHSFEVQSTQPMNLTNSHNQWQNDSLPTQSSFLPVAASDLSSQFPLSSVQHPSIARIRPQLTNEWQSTGSGFDIDEQQSISFSMNNDAQAATIANNTGSGLFPYGQMSEDDHVQVSGMPSAPLTSPFVNSMIASDDLMGSGRQSSPRKHIMNRPIDSHHLQDQSQQHSHSRLPHFQYQHLHQEQSQGHSPTLDSQGRSHSSNSGMNSIFLSKPEQ